MTKTTKPAAKTTKTSDPDQLVARERALRQIYRHVLPGTLRFETEGSHAGKLTVEIKCASRGCRETRRCATSDLFQVKRCRACTAVAKKAKRAAKAKAAANGKVSK
jgi:hypothetical protein